eukprot:XP_006499857.1 PREDICTED: uncharacterized protein LOC329554 isoform X3 [Mus musculus]
MASISLLTAENGKPRELQRSIGSGLSGTGGPETRKQGSEPAAGKGWRQSQVLRNFWRSPCVCVSFSRQLHQAASDVSGWSHRKLQDTEDQEMKPQSYPFLHPYPHPDPRVPQRLWRSG